MEKPFRSALFWIIAIIFTLGIAVYQRLTGPTHPIKGDITINAQFVSYTLLRSANCGTDAKIKIAVSDTSINGFYVFKRFKSHDEWTKAPLIREHDVLVARLPHQPAAGKIMYQITLQQDSKMFNLTENPVIMRFKGEVPAGVLIPHIIFMFLAMLLSTRTGLEAIAKGSKTYAYTFLTMVFLFIGGLILGPVIQKYAFDAYWTGWPIGHDLTDNKTIVAFIFWFFAFYKLSRKRTSYWAAILAATLLVVVYLIPHSVLGSELDYTQTPNP